MLFFYSFQNKIPHQYTKDADTETEKFRNVSAHSMTLTHFQKKTKKNVIFSAKKEILSVKTKERGDAPEPGERGKGGFFDCFEFGLDGGRECL